MRRVLSLPPAWIVSCLLVVTATLMAWHQLGMNRTLDLARVNVPSEARDDRPDGGASVASLQRKAGHMVLDCALSRKYAWPYCGYYFGLGAGATGRDLSGFDKVTVQLAYQGPAPRELRLYLHNFEPGFSEVGKWETQKVNEIEFVVPAEGRLEIPLSLLHTAAWWISAQNVPLLRTAPARDNVTSVDLYTGSHDPEGRYRLALAALRFEGKWISRAQLMTGLVALWGACGLLFVARELVAYRRNLTEARARLARLTGINRALKLEADELATQVYVDELTGAMNRQGLRDLLTRHLKTPSLLAEPCSLVFVDLDHFKRVNDSAGHLVGDQVLRAFAALAQRSIRGTDKLVRWGGEEFLIICPGTGADQALTVAEHLRVTLEAHEWPAGLRVTASFGVALMRGTDDFADTLDRADRALYRSKHEGRNRVSFEDAPADARAA